MLFRSGLNANYNWVDIPLYVTEQPRHDFNRSCPVNVDRTLLQPIPNDYVLLVPVVGHYDGDGLCNVTLEDPIRISSAPKLGDTNTLRSVFSRFTPDDGSSRVLAAFIFAHGYCVGTLDGFTNYAQCFDWRYYIGKIAWIEWLVKLSDDEFYKMADIVMDELKGTYLTTHGDEDYMGCASFEQCLQERQLLRHQVFSFSFPETYWDDARVMHLDWTKPYVSRQVNWDFGKKPLVVQICFSSKGRKMLSEEFSRDGGHAKASIKDPTPAANKPEVAVGGSHGDKSTSLYIPAVTVAGTGTNGASIAAPHGLAFTSTPTTYMVIDISAGSEAASYPVSYLSALPSPIPNTFRTNLLVLRRIPAGTFKLGSPDSEIGRYQSEIRQRVTLTKDFYIGVFEVTQQQWSLVMDSINPSAYTGGMRPMDSVSYEDIRGAKRGAGWPRNSDVDVTSFIGVLRAKTGDTNFDLPTEAQWKYACRAGTTHAFNNDTDMGSYHETIDGNLDKLGRYSYDQNDNKGGYGANTTTVGSYMPNAWGLYDMHGNVWEWCLNWHLKGAGVQYPAKLIDPKGDEEGRMRILCGGSWDSSPTYCRTAFRYADLPSIRLGIYGFRLLRRVP